MSEVVLVVLLGLAVACGLAAVIECNRTSAEWAGERTRLNAHIEALERERDHYRGNVDRWAEEVAARDTRIEELASWGERAEQALVYAATVVGPNMDKDIATRVDKACMDLSVEWALLATKENL